MKGIPRKLDDWRKGILKSKQETWRRSDEKEQRGRRGQRDLRKNGHRDLRGSMRYRATLYRNILGQLVGLLLY